MSPRIAPHSPGSPPTSSQEAQPSKLAPSTPPRQADTLTRAPGTPQLAHAGSTPLAAAVAKPAETAAEKLPKAALSDAERLNKAGIQAQDANQRGTRTAEIHPEVLTEAANGSKLTTYTMTAGTGPDHGAPVLGVDRQGPVLTETLEVNGHTLAPYAGLMGGCYMLGINAQETSTMSLNALMLATPDFAAPVFLQRFHVAQMSLTVGVAPIAAGGTGIKALESKDGWVQLEQTRKRTAGGLLLGGISNGVVGVSGRLTVVREREMVLKRWVKPDTAAALLRAQDDGVRSYVLNKAIALGAKSPLMQFPDAAVPETFEMRDELVCSIRGAMTGTVALATAAVLTGVNVNLNGEFELTVSRRNDETTQNRDALTVVVAPRKVSKSISAFIDLAVLAELRSSLASSKVTRQSYQFDMEEPAAMRAYQDLLRGQLPGAAVHINHQKALDVSRLVGLIGEETLPKGVTRVFAERSDIPLAASHVGGLTLTRYLPYLKWAGLSAEVRTQRARHSIADGESGVAQDEHSRAVEKQKLHYGTETTKSFARLQQLVRAKENGAVSHGIAVGAQMTLDRSRNKNRNVLTEQLNNHLLVEPKAKSFTNTDVNLEQTYDLKVERVVSSDDLKHLVKIADQDALPRHTSGELRQLMRELHALEAESTTHLENAAPLLGAYVRRAGLKGVGALHRTLGDDSKLTVTPKSSAKSDISKKKTELAALYHRPIEARLTDRKRLSKRVLQVDKAVKEAKQAATDLRQDPLLATFAPETLKEDLKAIDSDRADLEKLLDTGHLSAMERGILKRRLSGEANEALDAVEKKHRGGKTS